MVSGLNIRVLLDDVYAEKCHLSPAQTREKPLLYTAKAKKLLSAFVEEVKIG